MAGTARGGSRADEPAAPTPRRLLGGRRRGTLVEACDLPGRGRHGRTLSLWLRALRAALGARCLLPTTDTRSVERSTCPLQVWRAQGQFFDAAPGRTGRAASPLIDSTRWTGDARATEEGDGGEWAAITSGAGRRLTPSQLG